jgi:hypothetical protein
MILQHTDFAFQRRQDDLIDIIVEFSAAQAYQLEMDHAGNLLNVLNSAFEVKGTFRLAIMLAV